MCSTRSRRTIRSLGPPSSRLCLDRFYLSSRRTRRHAFELSEGEACWLRDEARDVKAPLCPLVFCVGRVVHGDRWRVAVAAKFWRYIFGAEFLGELVAAREQTLRAPIAVLGQFE